MVLLSATSLSAQAIPSTSPDSIVGVVSDASGARISGATVVVRARGTAFERFVDSSADGSFILTGLRAGDYEVEALAPGFAPAALHVTVRTGRPCQLRLSPAPVVEQVRVVSASRQDELRDALNTRVDVVTRCRIEDSGAETVAEVLRELPGVLTRRGSETAGV